MSSPEPESDFDLLWKEYSSIFQEFDDLTLARWMSQTLGQLKGKAWRVSHPLVGAYRLAAQVGYDRQIWFKRLATAPPSYLEASCCRAPLLPLLTREVHESGLLCVHCNSTLVTPEEIAEEVRQELKSWGTDYAVVHAVAHWDDRQRKAVGNYDRAFSTAADKAEQLLVRSGKELAPRLLEFYPAVVWEDQDDCLNVTPEDLRL